MHLSQTAAPLRELLEKEVDWHWDERHSAAFDKLRKSITSAPVLKYFDPAQPITLSVDASSKGLGAVVMHEGAPIAYASRALTKAEQNYAQIEREMLAITFGCQRFHEYLYGQEIVHVETDHKPIEAIKKKPIHCASPRIQRMLLKIQPYALDIKYKPGKELHIADALSRDYMNDTTGNTEDEFEVCHIMQTEDISQNGYNDLVHYTQNELHQLHHFIMQGWPESKKDVPPTVSDYWTFREELYEQDGILFKAGRLIVPPSMRNYTLQQLHKGHSGCERTKEKARRCVYWPGLNAEIDKMVQQCTACLKYAKQQQREPMIPHPVPERPWQVVGMDHFYFYGQDYLIIVDYFSKYPEVANIGKKTAAATIKKTKDIFARHGIPEKIVADNMPFNSVEFRQFCKEWKIELATSSPNYYRSHGQVERYVGVIKQMMKKDKESGDDPYLSLLELRNTPLTDIGYSPAELLMSRRLRSCVPVDTRTLTPQVVMKAREKLEERQDKQKRYYDRGTRELSKLEAGDTVRVHNGRSWEPAVVTSKYDTPRSYGVITSQGQELRRNRSHLRATNEPTPAIIHNDMEFSGHRQDYAESEYGDASDEPQTDASNTIQTQPQVEPATSAHVTRTRSGRISRAPQRYSP
jgi:hypothetical protein